MGAGTPLTQFFIRAVVIVTYPAPLALDKHVLSAADVVTVLNVVSLSFRQSASRAFSFMMVTRITPTSPIMFDAVGSLPTTRTGVVRCARSVYCARLHSGAAFANTFLHAGALGYESPFSPVVLQQA